MAIKTINCPACNELIQVDTDKSFVFCSNCGNKIATKESDNDNRISPDIPEYIYCFNCGQRIPQTSKFCPSCKTLQKHHIDMSTFLDTPQNKQENNPKPKKVFQHWYFWVLIIIIFLCTVSLFNLLNDDTSNVEQNDSTTSSSSEMSNNKVESQSSDTESSEDIASICDLEFVKGVIEQRNNESYLVVTYKFTNKSDKSRSFTNTLSCKAFQNGIECNSTFTSYGLSSYSFENANKEIMPGKSLEVQDAYKLNDKKTKVEIQVKLFSVWTDKVYKTFTVDLK